MVFVLFSSIFLDVFSLTINKISPYFHFVASNQGYPKGGVKATKFRDCFLFSQIITKMLPCFHLVS